jgi:hypothetical protein
MGFDVYRLSNITLIFLPANTTSIVQPIIAAFKAHRAQLVQFVISGSTETTRRCSRSRSTPTGEVGAARFEGTTQQPSATAGGRLASWGGQSTSATVPCGRRRNARAGNLQLPAMQGTLKRQHLMMW